VATNTFSHGMVETWEQNKHQIIKSMDVFPVSILIHRENEQIILNKGAYDIWLCDPTQPYTTKQKMLSVTITSQSKMTIDTENEMQNLSKEKRQTYCTYIYMQNGQIRLPT
tara:strand:- start:415 stop:747 length:333 start_codon:yes stop_codon:yes gene_type:complete